MTSKVEERMERQFEWDDCRDSLRPYPAMEFTAFGKDYIVSHENEKQCACCIMGVAMGRTDGECWAVEKERNCLRCLFSQECKKASLTLRQLGALARNIYPASRGGDMERVARVIQDQARWDHHPVEIRKNRMRNKPEDIQDLFMKYTDNAFPAEHTARPPDFGSGSVEGTNEDKSPEEATSEIDDEIFCSTVREESRPGSATEPLLSDDYCAGFVVNSSATIGSGRSSSSNLSLSGKINAFTNKNVTNKLEELLTSYVRCEGFMCLFFAVNEIIEETADAANICAIIDRAIRQNVVPDFPAYQDYKKQREYLPNNESTPTGHRTATDNVSPDSSSSGSPHIIPIPNHTITEPRPVLTPPVFTRPVRPAPRHDQDELRKRLKTWVYEGLSLFVAGAKWAMEALDSVQDNESADAGQDDEQLIGDQH